MKKLVVLSAVFFLLNNCLCAQKLNDSLTQLNQAELSLYYETKAKHQKTTAIVLASSGVALSLIGIGLATSNAETDIGNALVGLFTLTPPPPNPHKNRGVAVIAIGLSAMVASIPVALASAHNKRTAMLMLQNQTTFITPSFYLKQTTLGIAIPLGR